ncbi:MAG TPA: hypothetical protein VHZ29_16640 [Rhizomicrobium sp.]|jgi:hypothetical protein|nr:hypothetical protein [Rhizomicrobium sp.]
MRAGLLILSITAALSLGAQALADPVRPIFRIDNATAVVVKRHLVISANGAVKSGGWDHPRLWVREPSAPEAATLEIEFVARPPAPREAVVQALLPVAVRKLARLPNYGTIRVKIIAETNSLIVPITR